MSPEQMKRTKGVDARTDIWSLGVILFELVTGRRPFEAETVTELAIKVASDPAPPLRGLRPDAPAALEQTVARCLEKDRAHRFSDVGELAVALKALGSKKARVSVERVLGVLRKSGLSSAVLPPSGTFAMHDVSAKVTDTVSARSLPGGLPETTAEWVNTGEPARPRGRRTRAAVWIVGALGVGALAITGAFLLKGTPAAPPNVVAVAASSPPAVEPPTAPPPPASTSGVAAVAPAVVAQSPSVAPSPPAPAASAARAPSTHPAARPAPLPSAQPVPAGAAKPNCNPPYVIDPATGDRKYKLECL
jgi:serine/threonine-protein kinase